jgi:hypothetical protein
VTADKAPSVKPVMERRPLTNQRSQWEAFESPGFAEALVGLGARNVTLWRRRVGDGDLSAIVSLDPEGWHLSVSFQDHRGKNSRYPRWDEIADARYRLVPEEIDMCMHLPPPEDYVALHDTTFHLHEHR